MLPPPPPPRLLREGAAGCSDWLKCEAWVEDLRGTLSSGMSSPHAAASAAAGDRVRGGARAPPPLPPPPLPRGATAWARLPSCMGSRSVPSCSAESSWCAAASNSSGVISMASCISREAARTNSGSQYLPKPWSLSTLPTRFSAEPATGMTGFLSPGLVGTDLETLLPVSPLGAACIVFFSVGQFDRSHGDGVSSCIVLDWLLSE